jgi:tetratricopeptide (TPR) repeat protein
MRRKPLLIAAGLALVLVGLSIAGGLYATAPHNNEQAAQEPADGSLVNLPLPPEPSRDTAREKEQQAQKLRRAEYERWMIQGNASLAEQRYEDAIKAYGEAIKVAPQEVEAAKGLNAARTALAALTKDQEDTQKRKVEFDRLMDEGKKALGEKQIAQAVRAFEGALLLDPTDTALKKLLEDARGQLAEDAEQKKKLANYDRFLAAGRAALVAGRYADAIREFTSALTVIPNDEAALAGKRQAERRITEEQNDEKRRASFVQALTVGAQALKNKRFEEAVQAYELALKLYPGEKEAQQGLQLAKQSLANAQAQVNNLLAQAQAAMQLLRYDEAVRLYQEAARLAPNNEQVAQALRQAEAQMLNLQTAQQAYLRWMNQAAFAVQAKRWDDAARSYSEALRIVPNDADALLGLRNAQANLAREVRNRGAFNDAMTRAQNAYKAGRYQEAARAYQDALVLIPDDLTALNGLRQARYAYYMTEADTHFKLKRYLEAARDYENALREVPGDPAAARGLQQARALAMKK